MFIYLISFFLVILFLIYKKFRKSKKVIKFVGPRKSGKTHVLALLQKKSARTVPSLESYSVKLGSHTIWDIVPANGPTKGFFESYGINDASTYFFFFNSVNDLIDYERGYDVWFVKVGELKERFSDSLRSKLIVIKNDDVEELRRRIESC